MAARAAPYQAPAWLINGQCQTLYAALLVPAPAVRYRRERWTTPDGDFIDLDWVDGPSAAPVAVLFHGLEGSSGSHATRHLMAAVQRRGLRGVVAHFRGCGGEPNRLPRAYHAGDSAEVDWIVHRLRAQNPRTPLYALGISLGGNTLLKWLGEQGAKACGIVWAAATLSAPVDLLACGHTLGKGFNQVYTRHFLSTLKRKALLKLEHYPLLYPRHAVEAATTLREFDTLVTARLHGFKDAEDYWTKASSKPLLKHIQVPTLMINARNDPFMPGSALPKPDEVSSCVGLEFPLAGGHSGFVSGPFPGNLDWAPERLLGFFDSLN